MNLLLQHKDLQEPLTFASFEDVGAWARQEYSFWSAIKPIGSNTADRYIASAKNALQRLITAAASDPTETKVRQAWQMVTGELLFLSHGSRGQILESLATLGHEKAIPVALASMLNPEDLRNLLARTNCSVSGRCSDPGD